MAIPVRLTTGIIVVAILAPTAMAASLQWNGSTDNNWSTAGNWTPSQAPSTTSGTPDDLTFGTLDLNGDALSIGTNVFYVNDVTVGTSAAPPDFGAYYKDVATSSGSGKLVFQADASDTPSITVYMPSTDAAANAGRYVRIRTPIELQATTLVERVGAIVFSRPSTTPPENWFQQPRGLFLEGVISGNANLTLKANASGSWLGSIGLYGNNSFTGNVTLVGGTHIGLNHPNGFGNSANQVTLTADGSTNIEYPGLPDGAIVPQDFDLPTTGSRMFGLGWAWNDTTPMNRDCTWSGDFTGGQAGTNSLSLWARDWRRQIFTGTNSTFRGRVGLYDGSEVIVGGANAANVAWENVERVTLNSSTLGGEYSTAFLLRGSYTFNAPIDVANIAPTITISTVGQVNNGSTAYNATYTGKINVQEPDYQALNLYAEAGGSARFQGNIYGSGGKGFSVNRSFDNIEGIEGTGKSRTYGSPTGKVIIDAASRVALTDTGSSTAIGPVTVYNGTLQVDTANFYAASVTVNSGATLSGTGVITAPVTVAGSLSPGASPGTLAISDTLTLQDGSTFQVELGGTTPGDGPGYYDQVNLTNPAASLVLDGIVTLDASLFGGFIPDPADTFFILTREDSGLFSTFFSGLGEGATVDFGGGITGRITYQANWTGSQATSSLTGGNDVAIYNVVVPEPSAVALLVVGVLACFTIRRTDGRRRVSQIG